MKVQLSTSEGDIVIGLHTKQAPGTVENFLSYVGEGFYDGTIFHRVIGGFMIQAGGFETDMREKRAGAPIRNEADNGLANKKGTVAMARTSDPHSASAQFFINCGSNDFLNFKSPDTNGWGYCVFGEVIDGMDVVGSIESSPTTSRAGHQDVPEKDVVINNARLLED